jgi:hypothetical protein
MKFNWKTAFFVAMALLGWTAAVEMFVIMSQSTTIDMQKAKCAELEGDLKALAELLPGRVTREQLGRHDYQRLTFTYNEGDTVIGTRYRWDKFR